MTDSLATAAGHSRDLLSVAARVSTLALVALVALVSCGNPDGATQESSSTARPLTSTTTAISGGSPRDTTSPPAPGGERATDEPATSADQAAPAKPGTTQPAEPPAVTPPRPGTYIYSTSTDGQRSETTIHVENNDSDGEERRQTITRKSEDGERRSQVAWRTDGIYVRQTRTSNPEATCDWEPDFRLLALPLADGVTWSYSTTCETQLGPAPVTVKREGHFAVHGPVTVNVANAQIDTWEIRGTENQTVSGAFSGNSTDESVTYYSPAHGLEVRSTHTITGTSPQGSSTTTIENELTNLDSE